MASLVSIPSTLPGLLDALCYAIDGKKLITGLTNHKGCISQHFIPMVIYAIGGGCTNTYTCMQTLQTKAISRNQAWPACSQCMPGLKSYVISIECTTTSFIQSHYIVMLFLTYEKQLLDLYCLDLDTVLYV